MFSDYFHKFESLAEFIFEFNGQDLRDDNDSAVVDLVNSVYVGYETIKLPFGSSSFYSQSEIVDQVISICFKSKRNNLLTLGYSEASLRNPNNQLGSLINYFPNTLINELKSRPWEALLQK